MNLGSMVAWVAEADEPRGRAVALALSSRGASVLVTGTNERAIAECVGEIAHAGGKARHFVGDARTEAGAKACMAAGCERFGGVHLAVVAGGPEGARPAWTHDDHFPRVVTIGAASDEVAAVSVVLAQLALLPQFAAN